LHLSAFHFLELDDAGVLFPLDLLLDFDQFSEEVGFDLEVLKLHLVTFNIH